MSDSNSPKIALAVAGLVALLGVGLYALRNDEAELAKTDAGAASAPDAEGEVDPNIAQLAEKTTDLTKLEAPPAETQGSTLATLAWGDCPSCIGRPKATDHEHGHEGEGETPLRLAADADGGVLLLDPENGRVQRLGPDGKPLASVKLPFQPRDVSVGKDGALYALDPNEKGGSVTILDPSGRPRGKLPISPEVAHSSRRTLVSGGDVYVESTRGEYTRVGDTSGKGDPDAGIAAGMPTRDGTGWLSVRLVETQPAGVHVLVVERPSEAQRFSRLLQPTMEVEGIFMADTSADGTIYVGITGNIPGDPPDKVSAQLICLEGGKGQVLGVTSLPVRVGPEAILDAKALEGGGVVFSVHGEGGVRVERHDCR